MNRTVGIVLTIVTVLCCACPGFGLCLTGVMGLAGIPFTTTINGESSSQPLGAPLSIGFMCLSIILIVIPIIVAFITFRSKPAPAPVVQNFNEPLPPTS
jgi:hypothetical protein